MRILLMTVGTGVGTTEEKRKNLAHGLLSSILAHNPDKLVFFGSKESVKTLESLREQYMEKKGYMLPEDNYDFVEIDDVDDFYDCYSKMETRIRGYQDHEIFVDYTSGTKTMTTSIAMVAMLYQKKLFLTSGKRGSNGLVVSGTEEVKEQNLFAAYDKYLFDRVTEAFNSYRFEDAKKYLRQMVALEEKNFYMTLVEAYELWDKFGHSDAFKKLRELKNDSFLYNNKYFLYELMNTEYKERYLIPDLINNAKRRIEKGRYDDAVARLYRCIEMNAQYKLKRDYQLDSSNIHVLDLRSKPLKHMERYEKKQDEDGHIKLGLKENYGLLKDLNDDFGEIIDDKKLTGLLLRRNSSILAHGVIPVDKKAAEELLIKAQSISILITPDLKKLMEMSRFPVL